MKIILLFLLFLILPSLVLAQNQTYSDTFTITTYYPAPHGVYGTMRLYPSDEPTAGVERGVIYFNQSNDQLYIYQNDTTKWQPVGGSGPWTQSGNNIYNTNTGGNVTVAGIINVTGDVCIGGACLSQIINSQPLAMNAHTRQACTTARGTTVDIGASYPICQFNSASCPDGWTQYEGWSTWPAFPSQECIPEGYKWEACLKISSSNAPGQYLKKDTPSPRKTDPLPALLWGNNGKTRSSSPVYYSYWAQNCYNWYPSVSCTVTQPSSSVTQIGCF